MTYDEAVEIAEKLADEKGVYGIGPHDGSHPLDHPEDCTCRICFVTVKVDEMLSEQPELFE